MHNERGLDTSVVFLALTKPPMIMGVVYDYFLLAGLVVVLAFIYSGSFFAIFLFAPLHAVGWTLTLVDPCIFSIASVNASLGSGANANFWNCECYEPY